jgi:hypothetical protein
VQVGGGAAQGVNDLVVVSVQDAQALGADPGLGGGVGFGEQAPGGFPDVFQDMDEVDHDGDLGVVGSGLGVGALDLVGVAINQDDPAAVVLRVTAGSLVEDLADDLASVGGDAGGQPCAVGGRSDRGGAVPSGWGQDVFGGARCWGGVVDAAERGHAFALAFFSA